MRESRGQDIKIMCPRQAAWWFQSVSGSHLLVWIWGYDAFRSQRKKHSVFKTKKTHSLQIFYLITGFFFCACFLATSRMSCFAIMLSAGVCSAAISGCVIIQLKKGKNPSEALKHFFFTPLHEWATEWTVLLKLYSHSFIYMVNDCPFLAKKIQFLSFYSYFKSVVSALSCVTKKMILL